MTDRLDGKLRHVVVARYRYRHEAEFAAGFLDDACIPYRLQVDDAAAGLAVGAPATLWVRGMDVRRAQELLDLPQIPGTQPPSPRREGPVPARTRETAPEVRSAFGVRLTGRERALSAVLGAATLGTSSLLPTGEARPALLGAVVAVAAALGVGALAGFTVRPIRALLKVLSGDVR
jgi:hypothetical protein